MGENSPRRVAIVGSARIPFCRSNTDYAQLSNKDMLGGAIKGLVDRYGLKGERLGEVAAGAVLKHARDWNMTREVVLGSDLDPRTPAYDLQQACGTSLETTVLLGSKIALGQMDCGIAAGVDTTSDAPIAMGEGLRKALLEANRAKAAPERIKALLKVRPKDLKPDFPGVTEPRTGLSMGEHCERMAKAWEITRQAQDEFANASHLNAAKAFDAGFFDDLLIPFHGVNRDNNVRANSNLDKLAQLKPAFDKENGTLTAGNSTPLTDGAAAVLLASEEWAKARDLPMLAYLKDAQTFAVDYVSGREGLLMAPAHAVPIMLARNGLALQDFDCCEIHEAFAAQVLCTLKAWEDGAYCKERLGLGEPVGAIERAKLNPRGSSIALGHPFAATGARIVGTLAKELQIAQAQRGLISVCTAGGMGVTAILER